MRWTRCWITFQVEVRSVSREAASSPQVLMEFSGVGPTASVRVFRPDVPPLNRIETV